jgi:hypothetical protein
MTIAIPINNPLYEPLIANAQEVCVRRGITLLPCSTEREAAELLLNRNAHCALLTPIGYGAGVAKVDYRIVPATALMLQGLTYQASAYINGTATQLRRAVSAHAEDYLMQIGAIVLSEKFDQEITIQQSEGNIMQLLKTHDMVLARGFDQAQPIALDISDEWFDSTEELLPVAIWVCRPQDVVDDLVDILNEIAADDLPTHEHIHEETLHGSNAEREGMIWWRWTEDMEPALNHVFETLFYTQSVREVPAVKLWGRDPFDK